MLDTKIQNITKQYDLKDVNVSRETITTIEGFNYESLKIGFDRKEFDTLKEFEEYGKEWKIRGGLTMNKVIKVRELKREIKEGTYILMDSVEVERNLYLTILNEGDKLIVTFDDYNNDLCGNAFIDPKQILNNKKEDIIKLLNEIYYYNVNEPLVEKW